MAAANAGSRRRPRTRTVPVMPVDDPVPAGDNDHVVDAALTPPPPSPTLRKRVVVAAALASGMFFAAPSTYGIHAGMAGSFVLLEFPDPEDKDLLFLENAKRSVATRENEKDVVRYKEVFSALEHAAVPSSDLGISIEKLLAEMRTDY